MKIELFSNGVGIAMVNTEKNIYYLEDEDYGVYKETTREEFIDYLKRISWACLTSWNEQLKKDYLKLVEIVKEMK